MNIAASWDGMAESGSGLFFICETTADNLPAELERLQPSEILHAENAARKPITMRF